MEVDPTQANHTKQRLARGRAISQSAKVIEHLANPFDHARQLIAGTWRLSPYRELRVPTGPWEAGLALHTGPIRDHNEDYALVFQLDDVIIALLADGCGGILHGQHAAHAAVTGAATSIIRQLAWTPRLPGAELSGAGSGLEAVALQAVYDAAANIADQARRHSIDPAVAMRSTLIVAFATKERLFFAHIGDGGGCVFHRDDDSITTFVSPQRIESQPNMLTASLGSTIQGEPQSGSVERRRGDLIWLCSDGVADRTDPKMLGHDLVQAAIAHGGDLTGVAEAFLDQFTAWRDDEGCIFDDNMSLILISDPMLAGLPSVVSQEHQDRLMGQDAGHGLVGAI